MLVDRCGIPWMLNCQKPAYVQNERERVLALDIDVFVLIAQKQCLKLRHVPYWYHPFPARRYKTRPFDFLPMCVDLTLELYFAHDGDDIELSRNRNLHGP
jgi:hypothetical protein